MEETLRGRSGITLIALVITIIVLLVLAGIAISMIAGDNGILTKTKTTVKSNIDAQEQEELQLVVIAAKLAGMGDLTTDNLNNELRTKYNNSELEVTEVPVGWIYSGYTIYKDGLIKKGEILVPIEYTQVEYIESTGTQYIDTGVKPNNNTVTEIKCSPIIGDEVMSNGAILGARYSSGVKEYRLQIGVSSDSKIRTIQRVYNNEIYGFRDSYYEWFKDYIYNIKFGVNTYINGELLDTFDNGDFTPDINMYLFAFNNNGNILGYSQSRIYFCKIYDNDILVRNFIPCKNTSDIVGLYDAVSGTFYQNAGTGTFEAGNDL